MKVVSIGVLILSGAGVAIAQDGGRASQQLGVLRSAPFAVAGLPDQQDAIDAFFAQGPALGQGSPRPRQAPATAPGASGMWSFQTQRDTFRADALLDLRGLNEPVAGQSGFIGLSPDKNGFVRGDGVPERFWAVNYYLQSRDPSPADMAHTARFLAKRGVNLIRSINWLESHAKNPRLLDADAKKINQAWRTVAAMKKEGIYTLLTPYWSNEVSQVPRSWGIEDWPENQSPHGLLFFNPRMQAGYKAWLKALLVPRNPYTGVPLAQDPAVAMIQLQNEDSLLFWTSQNIKGKQLELLGEQFAEWAKLKYGTLEAALSQWNGGGLREDDPARGILGVQIVWQFTQSQSGGKKKRLDDQLQFFAETMYRFNKEMARYLREDLGCKQLINAGNWRTADSVRLYDAERWSYTANEVLAVNRYYSLVHVGRDRVWRINKGDQFQNISALFNPGRFPLAIKQVSGHPMMITESHWVPPLGYQSEAPFLAAAYQSLTGVDAVCWLGTQEPEWANRARGTDDSDARYKWAIATPMILGQFPAAALMFRRGDVSLGQPVVVEHRSLEQIWGRVPAIITEESGYDPSRDRGDTAPKSQVGGSVNPLAFLVGPVEVVYGSDPAKSKVVELQRYIDREKKLVRSVTGELAWDYGRGVCTVDAPRAQGCAGLLGPVSPIQLRDVTIHSKNPYATVLIVSLDQEPLAGTSRALVQVGTRARPTGWADHAVTFKIDEGRDTVNGRQVDDTGQMPWVIEATMVTITVRNAKLTSATLLDLNGNARGRVPVRRVEGAIEVELPIDAMYVVLSAQESDQGKSPEAGAALR
jgi:hypothetical protein